MRLIYHANVAGTAAHFTHTFLLVSAGRPGRCASEE